MNKILCTLAVALAGYSFAGELDVVYADAIAKDSKGADIPDGKYILHTFAMGGQLIPVYISSVAESASGLEIYPQEAAGLEYRLTYDLPVNVFYKVSDAAGGDRYEKLNVNELRTIGASGVDTVYAMVDMYDMSSVVSSYKISVAGRQKNLEISFFTPQITFIEKIPATGESPEAVRGQVPKVDGSYEEYRTGSVLDLYLAILKPTKDGSYDMCTEECNGIEVYMHHMTSAKIDFLSENAVFNDGYATISVRASKDYRWNTDPSLDNPATVVVMINEDAAEATYSPLFFSEDGVEGIKKMPVSSSLGARKYVVMDLQGRVVQQGLATEAEPVIKNLATGTYVVRIGAKVHRVNVR